MSDKKPATPMSAFATQKLSQEGVKLELLLPDGTPTEHWLKLRGADCKEFKTAQVMKQRETLEFAQKKNPSAASESTFEERQIIKLISVFVADWSFDEDCTPVNIIKFLTDSPAIAEQVNLFAGTRRNFFVNPSKG